MNERNMLCSRFQHDTANGQQVQNPPHPHPEPCFPLENTSNFSSSHINQVPTPSANMTSFVVHHLPEHVGRPALYAMTQYDQPSHPATNLELGLPASSNFFNLHLNPAPGARVFPVPVDHGFSDHLPSSSNYRGNALAFGEHGRSNYPTEYVRGFYKRKNAEGIPGNVQHFGASAGPSRYPVAPMISSQFDSGAPAMDASVSLQEYRGNNTSTMMEIGPIVPARHRSGVVGLHMDPGMVHNYNYLLQQNYGSQYFAPSSCTWLNQQSINNAGDSTWNGPSLSVSPYFNGSNIHGGSTDLGNSGPPLYPEASTSNGSATFLRSQPILQQPHSLHPPQNVQGVRGYGVACYPPYLAAPSRVPTSDSVQHDVMPISHERVDPASRPTGIRIYRPHGRSLLPDAAYRRRDLPRLRTLDGVALLEFQSLYEVDYDDLVDRHRDMRLDIDDMSYEELLALGDRIGNVSTGLSEDDIRCHLKTRLHSSFAAQINLEELPRMDQKNDCCIICQDVYEDRDKLGTLECGHEYHADCLMKWLLVKNICPICKSSGLTVEQKDQ